MTKLGAGECGGRHPIQGGFDDQPPIFVIRARVIVLKRASLSSFDAWTKLHTIIVPGRLVVLRLPVANFAATVRSVRIRPNGGIAL